MRTKVAGSRDKEQANGSVWEPVSSCHGMVIDSVIIIVLETL
jgi:hypothetical protein